MGFGLQFGGVGGRGESPWNMQILQTVHNDSITPCSPFGGATNIEDAYGVSSPHPQTTVQ